MSKLITTKEWMRGILLGVLLLGCPLLAQNWPVANCLAGVGDTTSTLLAIRSGASEGNPLLSNSTGGLRVPLLLGLKGASCGIFLHFRGNSKARKVAKILTFVQVGLVVNNSTVWMRNRRERGE